MNRTLYFLAAALLVSCRGNTVSEFSHGFTYDQIDFLKMEWADLFQKEPTHYYALVFSPGCQHCQAIEVQVVSYALANKETPLYFVEATPDIPKGDAIEDTIGASSIDQVFIRGWPTLLEIQNRTLINQFIGEQAVLKIIT